jgi:hypothetical protein
MNININNAIYNLHIIDENNYEMYKPLLQSINICNTEFISKSYEQMSYDALEFEGYVGFFLTSVDNNFMYISCIVDLNCSGVKENYGLFDETNVVEITLLCSNYKKRVIGLTKSFFNLIIDDYITVYKKNVEKILLRIAKGINNTSAFDFYSKIGFRLISKNIMEYNYSKKDKSKSKSKTSKSKSKTSKSKSKTKEGGYKRTKTKKHNNKKRHNNNKKRN